MSVLADLKNQGVMDVFFVVCDGLKGLPDSVNAVFPAAIVQACVIHLIRATLRYASASTGTCWRRICGRSTPHRVWRRRGRRLRSWSGVPSGEKWGKPYSAIPKLWRAAWEEFTPFLAYATSRYAGSCSLPND